MALYPDLNNVDPVYRDLFRKADFRRALSVAIDRDEINNTIFYGVARPSNNTVLPESPLFKEEYRTKWTEYDPDEANQLLDGLGLTKRNADGIRLLPDGRPLQIVVETAGEETEQTDVLELVADHWKEVGVSLFIKPSQREVFYNRINAGETQMSVWWGLENAMLTPGMAPTEFAPFSPDQFQWPAWGLWAQTSGQMGEEPDLPVGQGPDGARDQEWSQADDDGAARGGLAQDSRGMGRSGLHHRHRRRRRAARRRQQPAPERARARHLQLRSRRLFRHVSSRYVLVRAIAGDEPVIAFLARRLVTMAWTLLGISVLVFIIIQLPPGDYLTHLHRRDPGDRARRVADEKIAFLREQYGLDKPLWQQYLVWVTGLLHGDLGYSFEYNQPVADVIGDRLFLTMLLNFVTVLFIYVVSFPIGVYSATHQYSAADHGLSFLGFLGLATPNFLLALILLYLANVWFGTSIGGLMDPEYVDQPWSSARRCRCLSTSGCRSSSSAPPAPPA